MTDICANCKSPSLFVYAAQGTRSVGYCNSCLPAFLRPLANKGVLAKTPAFDELRVQTQEAMVPDEVVVEEEPPAPKRKRKPVADVVEESTVEVVVEEPIVEEVVVEEPAEEPVEAE